MTDIELVFKVKTERCNQSLISLIERHSALCHDVFRKYSDSLTRSGVYVGDIYNEKDNLIYKAAITYKPEKNAAFNTWLGNLCKFYCQSRVSKASKQRVFTVEDDVLDSFREQEFEDYQRPEICDRRQVLSILEKMKDKRVADVFKIRYFSNTDRPVTFKEIGKKYGLTTQSILNIHNKGIKELQKNYER